MRLWEFSARIFELTRDDKKKKQVCGTCTLSLDPRAPTTMRDLERRREEVRAVLRRLQRVFDDVDGLVSADAAEGKRMAWAIAEKEAREAAEREERAAWEMGRAEEDRARNVSAEAMELVDIPGMGFGDGEPGDIRYEEECEVDEQRREGNGAAARGQQLKVLGRLKKKTSGFKTLFGWGTRREYV